VRTIGYQIIVQINVIKNFQCRNIYLRNQSLILQKLHFNDYYYLILYLIKFYQVFALSIYSPNCFAKNLKNVYILLPLITYNL